MSNKILIIDDNEQDRKIMTRFLTKAGFNELFEADTGEKGVEEAKKVSPDIILVDTVLPGKDGFEICSELKHDLKVTARVIMMTGRIDVVDADKAKNMGADDYCVKTSDSAAIVEAVKKTVQSISSPTGQAPQPQSQIVVEQGVKTTPITWGIEKTNEAIKALYKELEKKNEELHRLNNLKSEFVSTVSHELRTPLTIIKGTINQLIDGVYGPISDEQRKKLAMALRNSDLLRRIIDDLLDVAKLEAKKVELKKETLDIIELADEVAMSFASIVLEKGLQLKTSFPKGPIGVPLDRDRIMQVFTNLLGNALKFTSKGSIEMSIRDLSDHIECAVSDTGRGISAEELPRVFDKFQQFGKSYSPGQEGTGLGLSICKHIIELHKGRISVESDMDKGTKFTFQLSKT